MAFPEGCSQGAASGGLVTLCCESADLDEVVGEYPVSAPGSGSVDAGEFGAVPSVAAFHVIDPSFASGAPLDLVAECSPVFELAARCCWFALARDCHTSHTKIVQVAVHRCLAVAAVGSDRAGRVAGASGDPCDSRSQLRGVRRVPDLDVVIENDPVDVVDDLGVVPELDGLAQASLADRTGIDIVQADHPAHRFGHHPAQTATGLDHNTFSGPHDRIQIVDRPMQPTLALPAGTA